MYINFQDLKAYFNTSLLLQEQNLCALNILHVFS